MSEFERQQQKKRVSEAFDEACKNLEKLVASGKSEKEIGMAIGEMAKKVMETKYCRQFDENTDMEELERTKQMFRRNQSIIEVNHEVLELAASGKTLEEMVTDIEQMAKKIVDAKNGGKFDEQKDKEQWKEEEYRLTKVLKAYLDKGQQMEPAIEEVKQELFRLCSSTDKSEAELGRAVEKMANIMMNAKYSCELDEQKYKEHWELVKLKVLLRIKLGELLKNSEELMGTASSDKSMEEEVGKPIKKMLRKVDMEVFSAGQMSEEHIQKLKSVGKELIRELDELRLSGKSEDEMAKNIGQMAKKWVEAHNFRKFDGQLDKKQWDKAKQCLEKKMEEMRRMCWAKLKVKFELIQLVSSRKSEEQISTAIEEMANRMMEAKYGRDNADWKEMKQKRMLKEKLGKVLTNLEGKSMVDVHMTIEDMINMVLFEVFVREEQDEEW